MEISIQPIVTEAATKLTDKLNRYTFRGKKPTSLLLKARPLISTAISNNILRDAGRSPARRSPLTVQGRFPLRRERRPGPRAGEQLCREHVPGPENLSVRTNPRHPQ